MTNSENKSIYSALPLIMAEVSAIPKAKKNAMQGYMYRGIEDVYYALQSTMAKHKVICVPVDITDCITTERSSKNGGILFYFSATFTFHFYASDGSFISVRTRGKAMDSGDKDENKAMSVAHKYALIQTFMIPTEDLKDPEEDSPEVVAQKTTVYDEKFEVLKTKIENKEEIDNEKIIRFFDKTKYRDEVRSLLNTD